MKKIIILIFSIFLFVSCSNENNDSDNLSNSWWELWISITWNIWEDNSNKARLSFVDMILDWNWQIATNVYEPYITGENILTLTWKDSAGDDFMILIAPELWSDYSTIDHNIWLGNNKIHFIWEVWFLEDRDNITYYYTKSVDDIVLQD